MTLDEFLTLIDHNGNAAPEVLAAFEAALPSPLPTEYRNFLLKTNGGTVPFKINLRPAPVANCDDEFTGPSILYGLTGSETLQKKRKVYSGRIPLELLAIGDDHFGNQICIGLIGDSRGRVYFWDHEGELDNEQGWNGTLLTAKNVTFQANTFDEYIEGLDVLPEDF